MNKCVRIYINEEKSLIIEDEDVKEMPSNTVFRFDNGIEEDSTSTSCRPAVSKSQTRLCTGFDGELQLRQPTPEVIAALLLTLVFIEDEY